MKDSEEYYFDIESFLIMGVGWLLCAPLPW